MANKSEGPKVGLTAEEWVRQWETDFAEFTHEGDHEHHEHHDHHDQHDNHEHHDHHGSDDGEHQGCGGQNFLKKYLSKLTRDRPIIEILVSLCGDSSDISLLADMGHKVTGIEVSEKAVKSIFENPHNPIPYTVTDKAPFKVYTATNDKEITIYVGNFFDISTSEIGPFDAVWDGHGIISLPEKDMQPYADKLKQLLKPDGAMLFSTVDFDLNELTKGPAPAPISTTQLQNFFSGGYKVELLEDDVFENADFEGVTKATNPVHLITKGQ